MFLSTYMGRPGKYRDRPFRFILNYSKATATNVYLLLYPKPALARRLGEDRGLAVTIWQALDRISQKDRIHEARVYGRGLYKLEPKELCSAPAAEIVRLFSGHSQNGALDAIRYEQLPLLVPG